MILKAVLFWFFLGGCLLVLMAAALLLMLAFYITKDAVDEFNKRQYEQGIGRLWKKFNRSSVHTKRS